MNKVLIILGMHRSGTSLMAQWLNECGLHLGDELLGATYNNKFGHYEDKDFLEFHREVLKFNNLDYDVVSHHPLEFSKYHLQKGKMLVDLKNSLYEQWGWKEPRTSLFTDYWRTILPEAKYLIVYRSYEQVVDSLLRREESTFSRRKNIYLKAKGAIELRRNLNEKANHYLKVWIHYNESIIQFANSLPSADYVLVSQDNLEALDQKIVNRLVESWEFSLNEVPFRKVFDSKHMEKSVKFDVQFEDYLVSNGNQIIKELENLHL